MLVAILGAVHPFAPLKLALLRICSRWSSLSATRGFSDPAEWAGTETSAVYGRK
ncbi:MAG: hypothetical protein ACLR0N_13195 [Bilophila wadsworthia]